MELRGVRRRYGLRRPRVVRHLLAAKRGHIVAVRQESDGTTP
jgi:hypothetical protein